MAIKSIFSKAYHYWVPDEYAVFPEVDFDLSEFKPLLRGKVLNAGAGWRDVSHLVEGELVNQDIRWPDEKREHIHIYSPLDRVPVESNHFDTVLCIAVLEHVENPEQVLREICRVLKPEGHLILEVPFLQPEHKVPTDFQRYTKDGLVRLVSEHGFRVQSIKGLFTVYHTLYWQVFIWLHLKRNLAYLLLRLILLRPLLWLSRHSKTYSDRMASGFQLVAVRT